MSSVLLWLRRDLRLTDNPALQQALSGYSSVIPVYIHDAEHGQPFAMGAASRWWLHHSLAALAGSLETLGSRLIVRVGAPLAVLQQLRKETGADSVFWNRQYEPEAIARDRLIKKTLGDEGVTVESFNGALLDEPWTATKADGTPYKVFTPYWKARVKLPVPKPMAAPSRMPALPAGLAGVSLESLALLPSLPWDTRFYDEWQPGEQGALQALADFVNDGLADYAEERNRPDHPGSSRLSPHLAFGEVSPRQVVAAVDAQLARRVTAGLLSNAECYIREIYWREFAYHLLYHFPQTPETALDERFHHFPWRQPEGPELQAWQKGLTGFPIIDAGMRELWTTGWMHNRVRMIVASLLTKNLRLPWQLGAHWFWDCLVDADLASNTLGWQWVAGCGADAAPYFRVFNPTLQGERFDPHGDYVKRWVPELAKLPAKYLHKPWEAPSALLAASGITLGLNYPRPCVDLRQSREEALEAYARIKQ